MPNTGSLMHHRPQPILLLATAMAYNANATHGSPSGTQCPILMCSFLSSCWSEPVLHTRIDVSRVGLVCGEVPSLARMTLKCMFDRWGSNNGGSNALNV